MEEQCFVHRCSSYSTTPDHLQAFRVNLGARPEGTAVQKQESSRARQGTKHSKARKPKPIRLLRTLSGGRASWPKVQAQQESGQRT